MNHEPIRILIYEDDDSLRESMVGLLKLEPTFTVCGNYPDGRDALAHIQSQKPDLILTDISMPHLTGIELIQIVRKTNPQLPIIVLTVFDDDKNVLEAIIAGANGYLLKKHISERLITAMKEALEGGAPMSPSVARLVVQSMQKTPVHDYGLTQREKEILQSLTRGNSYKLIASELGVSIDTVRTHIKGIYSKLQVHSQTEATTKALKERLV